MSYRTGTGEKMLNVFVLDKATPKTHNETARASGGIGETNAVCLHWIWPAYT